MIKWTDTLLATAREAIHNKQVTISPNDSPWYSNNFGCAKRKVERIHKRAKNTPFLWPYFRQLRNKNIDDLYVEREYLYVT